MFGIVADDHRRRWIVTVVMTAALLGVSGPSFWIAILAILTFSVSLHWLPTGGYVPLTENPLG